VKITWRGHSFFELDCADGQKIVIDPYFTQLTELKPDDLKPDLVLVTHGHADHLGSVIELNSPTIAIFELHNYLITRGLKETIGLNIGGTYKMREMSVTMLPAIHSGGITVDEGKSRGESTGVGYGGTCVGFIVDDSRHRVYHAGDTCLFGDMKTVIGEIFQPDTALLPIGGYYTMDPRQAAIAVEWLGVQNAIPMHYNTFDVIQQDPNEFVRLVGGIAKVHILHVDESISL